MASPGGSNARLTKSSGRARKHRLAISRAEETLIADSFNSEEAKRRRLARREYQINAACQIAKAIVT
jgi:hypothetical protein